MVKRITFDTEEELNEEIDKIALETVRENESYSPQEAHSKISIISIIYRDTNWNPALNENKKRYEAWINIEGY